MTEKRRPHHPLDAIKAQFRTSTGFRITVSAQDFAFGVLGLSKDELAQLISGIERRNFYKSMTSLRSRRIWQDVYHVPFEGMTLYMKFSATDDGLFIVISLKEK